MEMTDLVKNPVSFVGVRRSKFGRKGRSHFGIFSERAIFFLIYGIVKLNNDSHNLVGVKNGKQSY